MNESELLAKAKGGCTQSFERLMLPLINPLHGYIVRSVGEDSTADILQDTMLSAWQGMPSFGEQSSLKTWVFGIARRKIADHFRKTYRADTDDIDDHADIAANSSDIDAALDLSAAVEALSAHEHELLTLIYNAELTYPEISEITGIPTGTIKSRMHAIKSKLRKQLEGGA